MASPQVCISRMFSRSFTFLSTWAIAVVGLSITVFATAFADTLAKPTVAMPSLSQPAIAPLGPNDVLHITVEGQPDLTSDYVIDANGDITMLYVNKLHLGGLTPDAAQNVVRNALGAIYVNPVVTVSLASMGGLSITVTGAVQKQGSAVVRRDARLNDVIQVSIPTADADLTKIQLTRGLPGEQHSSLTVDLTDFLGNGQMTDNPTLSDGDVIYVPNKAQVTYSVSVLGAVSKPGRYDVQPGTTVYDLIKLSGGLDDIADHTGIYIQPIGSLDRASFDYDKAREAPEDTKLNPLLKDGDKVVAPEVANAPTISITGGVLKPGQYRITTAMSLTDAIGMAGGIAQYAKANQTTVTRENPTGGASIINVKAGDPKVQADFQLQPGDNVVIPPGNPPQKTDPLGVMSLVLSIFNIFGRL